MRCPEHTPWRFSQAALLQASRQALLWRRSVSESVGAGSGKKETLGSHKIKIRSSYNLPTLKD